MTTRELIEALFAAWQSHDAYRAAGFFLPDGAYAEPGRGTIIGRDAIFEHFVKFFRDGPAWRIFVDDFIVEGHLAAVTFRFAVKTSDDNWRESLGCALVRVENGLIALWREYHG